MIIEYIRYKIPESDHEKFLADYKLAVISLEQSAVCLGYEEASVIRAACAVLENAADVPRASS